MREKLKKGWYLVTPDRPDPEIERYAGRFHWTASSFLKAYLSMTIFHKDAYLVRVR